MPGGNVHTGASALSREADLVRRRKLKPSSDVVLPLADSAGPSVLFVLLCSHLSAEHENLDICATLQ